MCHSVLYEAHYWHTATMRFSLPKPPYLADQISSPCHCSGVAPIPGQS